VFNIKPGPIAKTASKEIPQCFSIFILQFLSAFHDCKKLKMRRSCFFKPSR